MKVVVTGASGFIGRHLTEYLIHRGHQVTAVVRRDHDDLAATRQVVVPDIGPESTWDGILTGADAVIHLAARVHVMTETTEDPLAEFRRINVEGSRRLAAAAANQGVRRFVFMSSIKVNGERTNGTPFGVASEPAPQDSYGISKHEAEAALREIAEASAMGLVVIRTPLVYGPGVGGNFARMVRLVRSGAPLPLGAVRNRRTMASVWNVVAAAEHAAVAPSSVSSALMLIGDDYSPSTPELLRALAEGLGAPQRVFPFPTWALRAGGAMTGQSATISRLIESLEVEVGTSEPLWSWSPTVSFAEGVHRTTKGWKA